MSLKAEFTGRRAYMAHVAGNRLSDAHKYAEAAQKHAQAVELYRQAIEQGCKKATYLMAYGVLLLRMREYEKARELMLEADKAPGITKDEKKQLRMNFAICQWKLGNLDKAIELMKSVAGDQKNSMLYGSLGYMLVEKARETGDFEEAIAFNEEAYEYDEDDAVVLDNLGQMHLAMGDRGKALDFFKRAHEQKPHQVDTLYYLALLYHEDGDDKTAKKLLDRALTGNYSALCTTSREQAQALLGELKVEEDAQEE